MSDYPRYEWVSVLEASRRLNRSASTIRRMIESGALIGEREPLAKGSSRDRYRVRLDATTAPESMHHDAPPSESPDAPETPHEAPGLTTRLLDKLDERDATIAGQHADIRALVEWAAAAEARAETLHSGMEQYIIDMLEQTERAIRAERERDELWETLEQEREKPWWKRLLGRT